MIRSIAIEGLGKTFVGRKGQAVHALADVDLDIQPGEFVSLLGPSGCGKSTLLKIIAGLTEPSVGTVRIGGTPVSGPSEFASLVFQKATLLRWRTILDNVLLPADLAGGRRAEDVAMADNLLRLVGLDGFARAYPDELSGGMQQRAAIVRALLRRPELLLMDEPFGALDEFTREALNDMVLQLWREEPKTVIFVTHSIAEAVFLSDRIVLMGARPGHIVRSVDVDLPRPRPPDIRTSSHFYELIRSVRETMGNVHADHIV
ncbi:MAG: ABC transporter ATP-binding protein [Burkholderiales bacterium]|nr:ABC transporter ATP-binding protein [Burkholderiales bacterium]